MSTRLTAAILSILVPLIFALPVRGQEEGEIVFGVAAPDLTEIDSVTGEKIVGPTNVIDIEFYDTPLVDVVDYFITNKQIAANIMYRAKDLQGTVSVYLSNVEWKSALDAILDQKGLMLKDNGTGVYSIVAADLPIRAHDLIYLSFRTVAATAEVPRLVSFSITNASWSEVVEKLAMKSELDLAYEQQMALSSSAYSLSFTPDEALERVLSICGLESREYRDFLVLGPRGAWRPAPSLPPPPSNGARQLVIDALEDDSQARAALIVVSSITLLVGMALGALLARMQGTRDAGPEA